MNPVPRTTEPRYDIPRSDGKRCGSPVTFPGSVSIEVIELTLFPSSSKVPFHSPRCTHTSDTSRLAIPGQARLEIDRVMQLPENKCYKILR